MIKRAEFLSVLKYKIKISYSLLVFYPIYLACKKDKTAAAKFFGIIVFIVFMDRPERWSLGRYTINERDIASMTYFRLRDAK